MFEFFFGIFMAFSNYLFLLGALVFFGIGGVLIWAWAWPRIAYKKFKGVIVGVVEKDSRFKDETRQSSTIYYPVVEYTDENGSIVRARTNSGSSLLANKKTGTELTIYADPDDPQNIQTGGIGLLIAGSALGPLGYFFLMPFIKHFEFNLPALIGLALLAGMLGIKGMRLFRKIRRDKPLTIEQFQNLKRAERLIERENDIVLNETQIQQRLEETKKTSARAAPIFALLGLALMIGSGYWGHHQFQFISIAKSAPGVVVDLDESRDSDGTTYYAIGDFKDEQGIGRRFRDKIGGSPALNDIGDEITVLYNPKKPSDAMIDRGWWLWLPQGILLAVGLFFFWMGASSIFRAGRKTL